MAPTRRTLTIAAGQKTIPFPTKPSELGFYPFISSLVDDLEENVRMVHGSTKTAAGHRYSKIAQLGEIIARAMKHFGKELTEVENDLVRSRIFFLAEKAKDREAGRLVRLARLLIYPENQSAKPK